MTRTSIFAMMLLGCVTIAACGDDASPAKLGGSTKISRAAAACGAQTAVGDDGHTITLSTQGEDDQYGAAIDTVACVLAGLDVSDFVASQIDNTRALDGMQRAEWDDLVAQWTYSPGDGLTISVHEG